MSLIVQEAVVRPGPRRYRPLVEVEAWQVTADNVRAVAKWAAGDYWAGSGLHCVWLEDEDTGGQQQVRPGEYVVRGVTGRFFKVTEAEFGETYEEIQP